MSSRLPSLCLAASLLLAGPLPGQEMAGPRLNSPHYEEEAAKLRAAPSKPYEFSKAVLGDVIRFLASDANISFFSLPEGSPEAGQLITFTLRASPFQALETLTKANGLALILDGGIWYIRPADDTELIGRAYLIRNNAMERVTKSSTGGGTSSPSTGSGGMGGSSSGGQFGGSNGSTPAGMDPSGGSSASGGIDLQGPRETFQVQKSELVNDIRSILDLKPESNGNGQDTSGLSPLGGMGAMGGGDASQAMKTRLPLDPYGNIRKPKVIWKSDSNTLYVVATRLQHMWVEGYLAAADQPQPLIGIEVKFFETSKDPSTEFGIDWSNTLGTTGTFNQVNSITPPTANQPGSISTTQIPQTSGGYRADLSNLISVGNLSTGGLSAPTQAVLSAQDLSVQLRALLTDQQTTTVSYPRMVTTNNREVVIRSVVNQPVLGGSASTSLSGGSTTTSAISYLPIGTVINILPKKMPSNKLNLNISITVSTIIGTQTIQGNPYPIASSRVYGAPVEVDSGYTVAIGGLDEATEQETDTGVPVLNKIPLVGYLFKTHSKSKDHKNLMLFITPTLIDAKEGGLKDSPEAILRKKPDSMMPHQPRLLDNGDLEGGVLAMGNAVAFLKRSSDELRQTVEESRGENGDFKKLADLRAAAEQIKRINQGYMAHYPQRSVELKHYENELNQICDSIARTKKALTGKGYY